MEAAQRVKEETELQFYGFTISQLVAEHSTIVEMKIESLLKVFLTKLEAKLHDPPEDLMALLPSLVESWRCQIVAMSNNMESTLNKYLAIPENVPLHGLNICSQIGTSTKLNEVDELKADFDDQMQTYNANKFLIKALQTELDVHKNLKLIHGAQMQHQALQDATSAIELQNIANNLL